MCHDERSSPDPNVTAGTGEGLRLPDLGSPVAASLVTAEMCE